MLPTPKFQKSKDTGVKCLPDGELSVGRKRLAAVRVLHPTSYGIGTLSRRLRR